jgi:hypothetical protein
MALLRSKPVLGATAANSLSNINFTGILKSPPVQLESDWVLDTFRLISVMGPKELFKNEVVLNTGRSMTKEFATCLLTLKLVHTTKTISPEIFQDSGIRESKLCALALESKHKQTMTGSKKRRFE